MPRALPYPQFFAMPWTVALFAPPGYARPTGVSPCDTRAARSLQTWAVGFGSVVRLVALTVLPPMSLPAVANAPSWAQLIWAGPPPTTPELA